MRDADPFLPEPGDAGRPTRIMVVGEERAAPRLSALPAGATVVPLSRAAVAADFGRLVGADLVVWHGECPDAALALALADHARRGIFALVACVTLAQVDDWSFAVALPRIALVIEGDDEDLAAAIGRALRTAPDIVAEDRDVARRLAELGDEVARIATVLARDAGPGGGGGVEDRRLGYAAGGGDGRPPSATAVRGLIRARRVRDRYFPGLFADPAWDILLDLYAARLEGGSVAVSSLCIAAGVPPTTGLRWISGMTEQGLLRREADPEDRRRVFIALSEDAAIRVEACIRAVLGLGIGVA